MPRAFTLGLIKCRIYRALHNYNRLEAILVEGSDRSILLPMILYAHIFGAKLNEICVLNIYPVFLRLYDVHNIRGLIPV